MALRLLGVAGFRASLPVVFHCDFWVAPVSALVGQAVEGLGGSQLLVPRRACQVVSQGQFSGRCRDSFRAEDAIRAGMVMIVVRIVAVVAFASVVPVIVPAARMRLKAMTASTSQAAFVVNTPEGRCARALFFKSALTCSMTA